MEDEEINSSKIESENSEAVGNNSQKLNKNLPPPKKVRKTLIIKQLRIQKQKQNFPK